MFLSAQFTFYLNLCFEYSWEHVYKLFPKLVFLRLSIVFSSRIGVWRRFCMITRGTFSVCGIVFQPLSYYKIFRSKHLPEKSLHTLEHRHKDNLYNKLHKLVSQSASTHIANEFDRVKYVGIDKSIYGAHLGQHMTYHVLANLRYIMTTTSITLEFIYVFWSRVLQLYLMSKGKRL